MRECDLIHNSLNLTTLMKKSYYKHSEDIFTISDINFSLLKIQGSSLENINLLNLKKIIIYIGDLQNELEHFYKREVTYKEIRFALQKRKANNFKILTQCMVN